jgi:hypothetical protein
MKVSEPSLPQTVTLLYRGVRRGAELLALLGEGRPVKVINSAAELANDRPPADVVVVDVPAQERRVACEQVRRYHRGPLVVLLDRGDSGNDLPSDRSRTLLTRPFSLRRLSVALAAPTPILPAFDPVSQPRLLPVSHPRLLMRQGTQDRDEHPGPGAGYSAVAPDPPRPVRSWRERRVVRVSAMSIMAALLFMGAFALVNQSDPCGPGCDELTGADLPSPSSGTVGVVGAGPYTTDPRLGLVGPTTTEPSVGPAADDGSPSEGSTKSGARISTTTASSSVAPTQTSSKDPSRPQPSAPSTTAPTTTKPRTPTTTATTTPTTTAPTTTTEP